MKKIYTKPTVATQEIVTVQVIATSFSMGEDQESGVTGAGKHNGEWGNLWKKQ
ncbi:MAG: hypothetical protein IJZ22_05900 [Bacteroidaceae bacterium]|nr:hypothetical protein [Bacteroidaceae bacterium]